ncbi:dTMP kinase [Shouchella clausii]|uniref:Thymidylate kinase n=1 Tax=Shouchella clausii TaxID=79880 RepID=A0A268NVX4_SHOCL|nr:dTMP kinase [Shouchella clausii]PAE87624.1 dTMP kinase [Shouchella clausii]
MITEKRERTARVNKKDSTKVHSNKMKIIAVEGLDKSGKHTATNVLRDYFSSKGMRVEKLSFPNYETPIGSLIRQWLKGDFIADEKTFELLQAADKQHAQIYIQECERKGVDVLLIDRYVHTEWAYGAYDNDERWLAELTRYMRLPDAVIYLDVEPEVSMHRRGKYGDNDYYESDIDRLRYTKDEYACLFQEKRDIIDTQMIDANQPPLIVKAQVLEAAGRLYEMYTGEVLESNDVMASVTEGEAAMIRSWSHVTSNKIGVKS